MKILFLSGREFDYQRNVFLYQLLANFGDVTVYNNKIDNLANKSILRKTILLTAVVLSRNVSNYDLVFIGFYGHFLVLLLRHFIKRPILFDAFLSTYDTLCFDRMLFSPNSVFGRLSYLVDKISCDWANSILLDTPQHVEYFRNTFGLNHKQIYSIPVGCDESIFSPRKDHGLTEERNLQVLSYSTYLPLHGMDVIIQAAHKLQNHNSIRFNLIGYGQEYNRVRKYAEIHNLVNVNFYPPVPINKLPDYIAESNVVLGGHFGVSDKAQRVIPGKIYQALAMGKAVIASDTPANRGLLTHGVNAIMVPPNDPNSLAEAILSLNNEKGLLERIAINGRLLFQEKCTIQANIPLMETILDNLRN